MLNASIPSITHLTNDFVRPSAPGRLQGTWRLAVPPFSAFTPLSLAESRGRRNPRKIKKESCNITMTDLMIYIGCSFEGSVSTDWAFVSGFITQ